MTLEILTIILSSALISSLITAAIAGWVALHGKHNDYKNEYFKTVISRRITAYEQIEALIIPIKVAVADEDGQLYHLIFSGEQNYEDIYLKLMAILSQSLWISDELFSLGRQLNVLVHSHGNLSPIEFGKRNYIAIGQMRTQMETVHARDMLSLHDVRQFLKSKKPTNTYTQLPIL